MRHQWNNGVCVRCHENQLNTPGDEGCPPPRLTAQTIREEGAFWKRERPSDQNVSGMSTLGEEETYQRNRRQAAVLGWVERELISDGSVCQRARRVAEEALELLQSVGGTREEALRVLEHVFARPAGVPFQEIGGVTVTLLACAERLGVSVAEAETREFARIHSFPPGHFHARQREKIKAGL